MKKENRKYKKGNDFMTIESPNSRTGVGILQMSNTKAYTGEMTDPIVYGHRLPEPGLVITDQFLFV